MTLLFESAAFVALTVCLWLLNAVSVFVAACLVYRGHDRGHRSWAGTDTFDIAQTFYVCGGGPFFMFWVLVAPMLLGADAIDVLIGVSGSLIVDIAGSLLYLKMSKRTEMEV